MSLVNIQVINKIPTHIANVEKRKTRDLLMLMAESLDNIREQAFLKYMIRNKLGRERRARILYKKQPTNPTKLTSRTRALEKMLTEKSKWRVGFKRATGRTNAIVSTVNVVPVMKDIVLVEGKASSYIANPSTYSGSKLTTKQKLAARFFWDSPQGIRGHRRPNISLAAIDEVPILTRKIQAAIETWR